MCNVQVYVTLKIHINIIYSKSVALVPSHILAIINIRDTKFGINVLVYLAQLINNHKLQLIVGSGRGIQTSKSTRLVISSNNNEVSQTPFTRYIQLYN